MTEEKDKNLIYVTGFGPFVGHEHKNASWEAVKLLPTEHLVRNQKFHIKLVEIPVIYDEVDRHVERIWKDNPKLVIHCGVHGKATKIVLEKFAYNTTKYYCKPDWSGKCFAGERICLKNDGKDTLSTCFDVEKIANELNIHQSDENTFECSTKVGNYLCGYIYLNSLDIDCERTIFIHVPPIDSPYPSQVTCNSILAILEKCVEQLMDAKKI